MKPVNELIQKLSSAIEKYDTMPVNEKPRHRFSSRLVKSAIAEAAVWSLAREIVKSARGDKKDAYSGTEPLVVGHLNPPDSGFYRLTVDTYHPDAEPLMTVKQHQDIISKLRGPNLNAADMGTRNGNTVHTIAQDAAPSKSDIVGYLTSVAGGTLFVESESFSESDYVPIMTVERHKEIVNEIRTRAEQGAAPDKEIDWKEEYMAFSKRFRVPEKLIFAPHDSKHYVKSDGENYTPAQFISLCQVALRIDQLWEGWKAAAIHHRMGE